MRKFLENKSLLVADCHCIHSQHEISRETIQLVQNLEPPLLHLC